MFVLAKCPKGPGWRRHTARQPGFQSPEMPSARRFAVRSEQLVDRRFIAEMPERGERGKLHSRIVAVGVLEDERQIVDGQTASPVRQGGHARQADGPTRSRPATPRAAAPRPPFSGRPVPPRRRSHEFEDPGPERAVEIRRGAIWDGRQVQFAEGGRKNGHLLVGAFAAAGRFGPLLKPTEHRSLERAERIH